LNILLGIPLTAIETLRYEKKKRKRSRKLIE
jgi:hypothetical protein